MTRLEVMAMYVPRPIDTSEVSVPNGFEKLIERIAENTHDVWAEGRIREGWTYGPVRDDLKKETPCLVSYQDLPETEKEYDRATALSAIKLVIKLGYKIVECRE